MFVVSSYPWTRLLIPQQLAGFQVSTTFVLVCMDTPVDSTATSWFPSVYNVLVSMDTPVDSTATSWFPSVYNVLVSMDTPVDSTATSWFPNVYNFHSHTFNTQRWFASKNRISAETCLPIRFLETGLHVIIF
jgi:hypothetical protein